MYNVTYFEAIRRSPLFYDKELNAVRGTKVMDDILSESDRRLNIRKFFRKNK